jgi:hypothetical protein
MVTRYSHHVYVSFSVWVFAGVRLGAGVGVGLRATLSFASQESPPYRLLLLIVLFDGGDDFT